METLKSQLKQLYLSKWGQFSAIMKHDPEFATQSHPHLISLPTSFENKWNEAELRIMMVGISTNGWGTESQNIYSVPGEKAIDSLMSRYERFYHDGGNWYYAQVFWNYVYAIQELLEHRLQRRVSVIWNNVHKTDPARKTIEFDQFNVLKKEIAILQPDMVLLLGLDSRHIFHSKLSNAEIDWDEHEVWSEQYADKPFLFYNLPSDIYSHICKRLKHVVVTYHPNARGEAGIKLKLLIDELVKLLK